MQCTKLSVCNLPTQKNQITLYRKYSTESAEPAKEAAPKINQEELIQITQQREPVIN